MIRLGILGSTRGTHLAALAKANLAIQLVISNKSDAGILQRANELNLPAQFLPKEQFDQRASQLFHEAQVDLIVLIGYMRILSTAFVKEWRNKIINVHPSLLPLHAGLMDLQVHRAVLAANEKETGCTVHYVTEKVDAGPILLQKRCVVLANDTPERIKARVQELEAKALIEAILKIDNLT